MLALLHLYSLLFVLIHQSLHHLLLHLQLEEVAEHRAQRYQVGLLLPLGALEEQARLRLGGAAALRLGERRHRAERVDAELDRSLNALPQRATKDEASETSEGSPEMRAMLKASAEARERLEALTRLRFDEVPLSPK